MSCILIYLFFYKRNHREIGSVPDSGGLKGMRPVIRFILIVFLSLFISMAASLSLYAEKIWTDIGLFGGYISHVEIDPENPEKMFAAAFMGDGLYVTLNGGTTWEPVHTGALRPGVDSFKNDQVLDVKIAPSNSDIVWATHNFSVEVSTDGGETWIHLDHSRIQEACVDCGGSEDNLRFCRTIEIDPYDSRHVYIGTGPPKVGQTGKTGGALYETRNAGLTWRKLNGGNDFDYDVLDVAMDSQHANILWVVTNSIGTNHSDGSIYRSIDGGETWQKFDNGLPSSGMFAVSPVPGNSNIVFSASVDGIIRHEFNGDDWIYTYPIPESTYAFDVQISPVNTSEIYAVWNERVSEDGTFISPKISISKDGGDTWETITLDSSLASGLNGLAIHPLAPERLIAFDGVLGIIGSDDGGESWTSLNQGINSLIVYDVATDFTQREHIIAGTISGLFERKSGQSWRRIDSVGGRIRSVGFDPMESGTFYAGSDYGFVYKTTDGGMTFTAADVIGYGFINHIAVNPSNRNRILIAANGGVLCSKDGGGTFGLVLEGTNEQGENYNMNVVAFDPSNDDHVFAGGGNFTNDVVLGDLWESMDGGGTWQRTTLTERVINDVIIDPVDPNTLYAGCGSTSFELEILLKSIDGGKSWTAMEEGLPNLPRSWEDVWGLSTGVFFVVGGEGSIFRVDDKDITQMDTNSSVLVPETCYFYGIYGLSEQFVFAVGTSGTIFHYNGQYWSIMNSGRTEDIHDIWGNAPDNFYAVGEKGLILHYDGFSWTAMESGVTQNLWGIFGTSATNIFAVGDAGTILHYDGSAWTIMPAPTGLYIDQVFGFSSDEVYAVGGSGTILRYNGSEWLNMSSPTTEHLDGLWGSAPDNLYVIGLNGTILNYNGLNWKTLSLSTNENLKGIYGISSNEILVAGGGSGMYAYKNGTWTIRREEGVRYRNIVDLEFGLEGQDVLYAAALEGGVYVSANGGGNWVNLSAPDHSVFAIAPGSLFAATQGGLVQCTGTGVIAGYLFDTVDKTGLDGATVFTDFGIKTLSVFGEYLMLSPAGIFSVTAVYDNRANAVVDNVTVLGGEVTFVDMNIESGLPDTDQPVDAKSSSGSSGGGCFLKTIENPMGEENGDIRRSIGVMVVLLSIMGIFADVILRLKQRRIFPFIIPVFMSGLLYPSFISAATLFQQVGISSSPNPVGSGARAMGMGGAFIAVADDATAASWNPAGLIQLEKPELSIVGEIYYLREEFSSTLRPEVGNTGEADDLNINYFSAAYPFHFIKNMVVSINYQRLYDFNRSFNHALDFSGSGLDLFQQKSFSQDGYVGALGLAGSVEITPTFSAGGTLNIWTPDLFWKNGWNERYKESAVGTLSGVPVLTRTELRDDYRKFRGINFNFGFLWNITSQITLGGVIKTPFTASLRHRFEFTHTQTFEDPVNTTVTSRQSIIEDVDLDMPLSYGVGLSWRISDAFTIAFDVYRTKWDDYIIEDSQGNEFSPVDGRPKSLSDVDDTTQFRVGCEYLFISQDIDLVVPLRTGFFYDPSPSEGSPEDIFGFALGSGISYKNFIIDAAYQLRWGSEIDTGNLIATSQADIFRHSFLLSMIYHF